MRASMGREDLDGGLIMNSEARDNLDIGGERSRPATNKSMKHNTGR